MSSSSDTSMPAELQSAIDQTIEAAKLPGLALAFVRGGGDVERIFIGEDAEGNRIDADTLFPVASITKLATALVVLRLADAGALDLDDSLSRHLPEAAAAREGVTIRKLLCHSGGLPIELAEGAAPYEPGLNWPALARACLATPLERQPGTHVQYSNPGYGLLAAVVERVTGATFSSSLSSQVLEPLGIEAYLDTEPPRTPAIVADVRSPQVGTPLEPFNSAFWRSLGMPWGGLVTTLDGALALVRAFQDFPRGFLQPETLADATRNQTDDLGGGQVPPLIWPRCPWGLGPELRGEKSPHWSPSGASPDSFGHAGASGALAWVDPASDVAWAICGTRTANNGWLVRHATAIGAALIASDGRS